MADQHKDTNQSAKERSSRHDLTYFKRWEGFRLWRLVLSLGLPAFAGFSLTFWPFKSKPSIYAGPLSSVHSLLANHCEACHIEIDEHGKRKRRFLFQKASGNACKTCHEAPAHHPQEFPPPACSDCHVEHQGTVRLIQVRDQRCVDCHENLLNHSIQQPSVVVRVIGFNTDDEHPTFLSEDKRSNSEGKKFNEPLAIIFQHGRHLGQILKTSKGQEKGLDCKDCHRPVASKGQKEWPYAQTGFEKDPPLADDPMHRLHRDWGRDTMTMPNYEQHCADCHALNVGDPVKEPVPHPRQPAEVAKIHAFLVAYFKQHPAQPNDGPPEHGTDPSRSIACAEQLLWGSLPSSALASQCPSKRLSPEKSVCGKCHEISFPNGDSLPTVKPTNLKPPLMPHAIFSHEAHVGVTCRSCHQFKNIALSEEEKRESDNVMPSIDTCRACHSGSPPSSGKAENGCFLCHQYHKWDPRKQELHVPYTVEQLRGNAPLDQPATQ